MSIAALQATSGDIFDGLVDAGFADAGTYTAPSGSPVPVRVVVLRAADVFGDFGGAVRKTITIYLLLSEVPAPQRDALVVADGATFRLVKMVRENGAISIWEVE